MIRILDEKKNLKETVRFGKILKETRESMGMNQTDFGEVVDANQNTVSMWELGVTCPAFDKAEYILKVLGYELVVREKEQSE